MIQYVTDRFEGELAVVEKNEDGRISYLDVKRSLLPKQTAEGDVLAFENGIWTVEKQKTQQLQNSMKQRLKKLAE